MLTVRTDPLNLLCVLLLSGLLAGASAGLAHAQSGMRSVEAVSTGGGTSALDTGPSALYSNPANLTVGAGDHSLEIQLFRVGAYTGGDFHQFDHIKSLFYQEDGQSLSNQEEKAILDEWFGGEMRRANTYVEVVPLTFTYRPSGGAWAMGLGVRGRAFQASAVNKGFFDALLRGTGVDRVIPIDGRSRSYSTVDVTAAFSYRFPAPPLLVGVLPRSLLGPGFADATLVPRAMVQGDSLLHRFDYTARAAGPLSTGLFDTFNAFDDEPVPDLVGEGSFGIAGRGLGIDLGATYTVRPNLHVSASITDLGRITWSKDAQTVTPADNSFEFPGVALDMDRLDDEFGGDVGDYVDHQVDSLAQEAYQDVERDRSSFTTSLPTTLHLSSTWGTGFATLNGGVSVGLNEKAGAVPDPAAVHLGSTLHLGPIPIRLGVRAWGTQAVTASGGFGLDFGFYRLDLGASVTPNTSTLGSGGRYAVSFSLATIRF